MAVKLDLSAQSLDKPKFQTELNGLSSEKTALEDSLSNVKQNIHELKIEIDKTLQDMNSIERLLRLESEAPPDSEM